jgi:hypothetical protein
VSVQRPKNGSSKHSKKGELYDRLLSRLEEDFWLSPNDQIIPGGIIIRGTPEEEQAQCKEIEKKLMREYAGRIPNGTVIIIRFSNHISITD